MPQARYGMHFNQNAADMADMRRYEPRDPATVERRVLNYPERMMQPADPGTGQIGMSPAHQDFMRELAQIRVAKNPQSGRRGDISKDARVGAVAALLQKYGVPMPSLREMGGTNPMLGLGANQDQAVPVMMYAEELLGDKDGSILEDALMRLPSAPGRRRSTAPVPRPNALQEL